MLPRDRTESVLVFLIALIGAAFYHPGGWNQNARLAAAVAFVEPGTPYTGTFRIDGLFNNRFRTGDWARVEGRLYSNKAPGASFLGVAPYFLLYHGERLAGLDPRDLWLTNTNAYLLNLCISVFWNGVAALALLRKLPRLGLLSPRGATLVSATYAFATLMLPYTNSVWGHSTAAAFVTLGTLALFDKSPRGSALAGWWFGVALLTEYLAALSLGLAGLFLLVTAGGDRLRHVSRFVLGSALPVGALLVYQKVCFGGYFTNASGASNPALLDPTMLVGQFGGPNWQNLVRLYFSTERGVFQHMPILALTCVGLLWSYRPGRRAFLAFAIANIAGYSLAVSALTTAWHGGVTTSARYLIVALPFFCLLLPDLTVTPVRGAFVVLLAITAANMFVVAATSTLLVGTSPVYGVAYPQFWHGDVAFNPLLAAAGVKGLGPALFVALMFAAGLTWIVRAGLHRPETPVREALLERLSKRAVLASLLCAVFWSVWQTEPASVALLALAAATVGLAFAESRPLVGATVLLLLAYVVPPPYRVLWTAALAGLMTWDHAHTGWSVPPQWRPPLILWALTVAVGWPLLALRELDFEWPGLLARYAVTNTATGSTPGAVIALIANAAAVHLLGLLWLDWLFRRFASSGQREMQRWVMGPLAISVVAGLVFAVAGSGRGFLVLRAAETGTVAATALPAASIASHPFVGVGLGLSSAPDWWRQPLADLGILGVAGIVASAVLLIALLLRARAEPRARLTAAALCGVLLAAAVVSMRAFAGLELLLATTAGTLAFLLIYFVNRDTALSVGAGRLTWVGVGAVLVMFLGATVIAARGELRVPWRAAQGGWPYTYGIYPAAISGSDGAYTTERHGVTVVTIDGPAMILTIRAEHPDIREHPVTAQVDVNGHTVIRSRLYTSDPLVRTIDLDGVRRAVIETRVDRTWRDPTRAGDQRDIGLSMSWKFAGH
jgi:hypothetical protein